MLTPLLIYQLLVLAVLLALLCLVVLNMLVLPGIKNYPLKGEEPRVAILVPARDEEANIGACLKRLLAQDYTNYSIWLYNDASTDAPGWPKSTRTVSAW